MFYRNGPRTQSGLAGPPAGREAGTCCMFTALEHLRTESLKRKCRANRGGRAANRSHSSKSLIRVDGRC